MRIGKILLLIFVAAALAACGGGGGNDPADNVNPTLNQVAGVTDGQTVSGTINLNITAADNVGITQMALAINGTQVATSANGTLAYSWDTTQYADGPVTLVFTARDAEGNTATATYNLTVDNSGGGGGEATVTGVVYAPNGEFPVSGAMVWIEVTGGTNPETTSDTDGSFTLTNVPTGSQTLMIEKGAFTKSTEIDVSAGNNTLADEDTTLPSTGSGGDEVEAMAVVTGDWDVIQDALAKMGLGDVDDDGALIPGTETFDLVDGNFELDDATYPNFDTWVADSANLAAYRTIFINCGNGYEWTFFDDTDAVANLRSWVENGGRLYATDLSYDFVEQLFPGYIDFYGDDEADGLGTTPEEQGAAEWGDYTEEVSCTILDSDLLAWLQGLGLLSGTDQAVIHGWLSAWAGVDAVANGVKVWVEGPAPIDGSTDVRPVTMTFSVGDGTVFFSSYHTEAEFGTDIYPQERILQYMILEVL